MKPIRWPIFLALLPVGLFVVACSAGGRGGAADRSRAPVAPVVKAVRHDLADHLEIASEFRPYQEVDVYAKVSGYIQKLNINWGAHVKQGQLLAVLEIPELEQQLRRDNAVVRRGQHDVTRFQEDLKRAASVYTVAHLTYTRLADVQEKRPELIAQQEIDVAEGKDREAGADVAAAQASLQAAEESLQDAEAALKQDQEMFAYARITAPFDSVVTRLYAYTGALLPAGTSPTQGPGALCHLSQNNLLRLVIPLPQRVLPDVHVGQSVAVKVTTLEKTFQGRIALFSDEVDLTTRTMHTEVTVPNPDYELVTGMYASVEIPLHVAENVIALPVQAVQMTSGNEGSILVVNKDNRIEKRTIAVDLQTPTEVEVASGVHENERVIFGAQGAYREGELVVPQEVIPPQME